MSTLKVGATGSAVLISVLALAQGVDPIPDLKWKKDVKEDIDKALASGDEVSIYLGLKAVLEGKKVKGGQKAWLEEQLVVRRAPAMKLLDDDLKAAEAASDLRSLMTVKKVRQLVDMPSVGDLKNMSPAMLMTMVGNVLQTGQAFDADPAVAQARAKALSGAPDAPYVWKVSSVSAVRHKGSYSSGSGVGRINVSPTAGRELVRVKARIENVSAESDRPYLLAGLGSMKSLMSGALATPEVRARPHRWLDDGMIYLATSDTALEPCLFVAGGDLSSMVLRMGSGTVVFPAKPVPSGGTAEIDVLFSVPRQESYRLLVLGGPGVQVEVEGS